MSGALAYQEEYETYEIINGETYMMSSPKTNHTRINGNLHNIFSDYLKGKRCESFNNLNLFLDEDNFYIPDEMIVCNPDIVEDDGIHGVPDLIDEILSKSTADRDRYEKFAKYEQYGVKEYWIVDPFMKRVEVYHLKDGKFVKYASCQVYTDREIKLLSERERAEIVPEIKVSLYDDFIVQVKDIFERVN